MINSMKYASLTACMIFVWGVRAGAQDVVTVAPKATCASCKITLRRLVTLGADAPPMMFYAEPTRDRKGRYYVRSNAGLPGEIERILLFSPEGKFTGVLGRQGRGPGEFTDTPTFLLGANDTLFAFDQASRLVTVFSPDHKPIRTIDLSKAGITFALYESIPGTRMLLPDGTFAIAEATPSSFDPLVRLVSPTGSVVGGLAFVDSSVRDRKLLSELHNRRVSLALGPKGEILVARAHKYRIETWTVGGRLLRALEQDAPWFVSQSGPKSRPAYLVNVRLDDKGRLWTLSHVSVDSAGRQIITTFIEVIDPATGTLIVSEKLPGRYIGFWQGGIVQLNRENSDGIQTMDLFRPELKEK
jgi:hypothetical protein